LGEEKIMINKELHGLIKDFFKRGEFNGSVLVAKDGEITYKDGFGFANMEWGIPNRSETKHKIGSLTKQFTSFLIFLLHEDKKIDFHDTISDYLTYFL
jgi:CubicO group peptidase (beta-lactamase class C family)